MKGHLLSDTAIFCGVGSSLLVLLDWFLMTRQKEWIRDATIRAWYWLSVQTPQGYLRFARTRIAFAVCFALGLILGFGPGILTASAHGGSSAPLMSYEGLFIIVPSAVVWYLYGYRVYSWLIAGTVPFKIFRDLTGLGIVLALVFQAPLLITLAFPGDSSIYRYVVTGLRVWNLIGSLLAFPLIILLAPTQLVMLAVSAVMMVFAVLRGIAVRVAEHDKGPMLAVSALLTMLGAIVKAMQ